MIELTNDAKYVDERYRDYCWNYFELHADQRMKAFHFFILLATAVTGGFGLLLKNYEAQSWMSIFGVILMFFSFVFWKLDQRTSQFIKHAEAALQFLDEQFPLAEEGRAPHRLQLFAREAAATRGKAPWPLISGHFSYGRCFRWVFAMFFFLGLGSAVACLGSLLTRA